MNKIGLAYVKGAVSGLENFGNLPTDLIKSNGLLNGNPISEELDVLILPGGSLIESGDISENFKKEIIKMANDGKPIIGICAGFQLLSNKLDVGDESNNDGLGLIDVYFSPLTLSEHLKAKVYPNSFLTEGITEDINGYHTHNFGKVEGDGKPLFYSKSSEGLIFSGASSDDGNVIGTMIHNILDENPNIVKNLLDYIDVKDVNQIYEANKQLKIDLNKEIGVSSNIPIAELENPFLEFKKEEGKSPRFLMISSTDAYAKEGKSFFTIGLAGALRKQGLNVGLLKIGKDVTDLIPALYLTKGVMENYTSIDAGFGGWVNINEAIASLKESNYDIILIEGMGCVCNDTMMFANQDFKICSETKIPLLLVSSVKGDLVTGLLYSLKSLNQGSLEFYNFEIAGALFNHIKNNEIKAELEDGLSDKKIKNSFFLPEIEEVTKLKYDVYGEKLLEVVSENINIIEIANITKSI